MRRGSPKTRPRIRRRALEIAAGVAVAHKLLGDQRIRPMMRVRTNEGQVGVAIQRVERMWSGDMWLVHIDQLGHYYFLEKFLAPE